MPSCICLPRLLVLAIVANGSTAFAQPPATSAQQEPTWVLSSGSSLTLFPSADVYPLYVADPHRPTNLLTESTTFGGSIPETDSPLTHLSAGGRFGILRIGPGTPGGRAWQISVEAGLDALFDSQNRLDVVGWDGNYGLTMTTASSSRLAFKLAVLHVSAHLGDEYQARVGRERINYTREELSIGVAWRLSPRWNAYGETGVAYRLGQPDSGPWRVQSGIQYESRAAACMRRFACYAALDVSTMEERSWRVDMTVDFGIVLHGPGRSSRIFVTWHDGRPTANEFFRESLSSLGLGIKIDL